MGERFRRRVRAVAEALFSPDGATPPPADELEAVVRDVEDFVSEPGPRVRRAFALATWLLTWLAPLLAFRLPPLGRLPLPTRIAVLERLERGRLAPLVVLVKVPLSLTWFERPDTLRSIGCEDWRP